MPTTLERESVAPTLPDELAPKERLACWRCNATHLRTSVAGERMPDALDGDQEFRAWIATTLWSVAAP